MIRPGFKMLCIGVWFAGMLLGASQPARAATYFSVDYMSLTNSAQPLANLALSPMPRSQGLTLMPFYFHVHTPAVNTNWGIELYSNNRNVLGSVVPPGNIYRGLRERLTGVENIPLYWQVYPSDQNVAATLGTPQSVTLTVGGLALFDHTLNYWGRVFDRSDQDRIATWDRDRPFRIVASANGLGNYPQAGRSAPIRDCFVYFGADLRNTTDTRQFAGQLTLDFFNYPSDYSTGGYATPNPVKPLRGQVVNFNFFTNDLMSPVWIHIYDLTGRPVITLQNTRTWDCRSKQGGYVEGGLYIYQIHAEGHLISGTVVVLK